ncbi:MAG: NUDIX hydrolase [Labilithrix sp.]|nr:NUDIX hydrolase [Labilithrix sp.]
MPFTYPYPRPSVTCDVVAFTMRGDDLAVLLIRRKEEPFRGCWALPGGFVNENESLERAAARELYEETGLSGVRLEQLGAFGDPGRDPRGHTVTVAYVTFRVAEPSLSPGDDAVEAAWKPMRSLALGDVTASRSVPPPPMSRAKVKGARRGVSPPSRRAETIRLAFDHAKIVSRAYRRICRHLDDPIRDPAFDIVPPRFTLAELRRIYEIVLGRTLTPRIIKQHLVDRGLVVPATTKPSINAKDKDLLYRWNRR